MACEFDLVLCDSPGPAHLLVLLVGLLLLLRDLIFEALDLNLAENSLVVGQWKVDPEYFHEVKTGKVGKVRVLLHRLDSMFYHRRSLRGMVRDTSLVLDPGLPVLVGVRFSVVPGDGLLAALHLHVVGDRLERGLLEGVLFGER